MSFANQFAGLTGGNAGVFLNNGNSTAGSGGGFITSIEAFTYQTTNLEVAGAINRLDTANVPNERRCWFMHPRTYNYLFSLQNSLSVYVYRPELRQGTFYFYPIKISTQIPINIWDTTGTNKDCSFVFLAEMTESLLLDSMETQLAVSHEAT
jgi:HK97 family phage major capsid protein